jgi:hypothetical protein
MTTPILRNLFAVDEEDIPYREHMRNRHSPVRRYSSRILSTVSSGASGFLNRGIRDIGLVSTNIIYTGLGLVFVQSNPIQLKRKAETEIDV